ncbi:MAG: hypothetical protein J7J17_03665 [Hadesarchaea archaeon]|nr:hypothetical protein [Hadesarchaea archaeon]
MRIKPLSEIMEEMHKRYRRYPKEQKKWRVLGGRDERGFTDLFFYEPEGSLWHVKGEPKSPYELLGAGARFSIRKIDEEIRRAMEQGRPLPFGIVSPHPTREDIAIIAAGIGRYQKSTRALRELFSPKQRKIDKKLSLKIEELRRRYGLDTGYG